MSNKKLYRQKDFLYQAYHIEKLSARRIADICGVCEDTIKYWFKKYNIKTRTPSEVQKIKHHDKLYSNKDFLYQAYHIEKLSTYQIADICNCMYLTILKWLKKYNIQKPDVLYRNKDFLYQAYHIEKLNPRQIAEICGVCSDTIRYWLKKYNIQKPDELYHNKDFLYQAHHIENLDVYTIAGICDCSKTPILRYFKKYNIKTRNRSEAQKLKHPDKLYYNKDFLYQAFRIEKLSAPQIADICNCSTMTILNWLKKYNIQKPDELYHNKDFLYQAYHIEKISTFQIANICNCSNKTIFYWLKKYNIEIRSQSESTKMAFLTNTSSKNIKHMIKDKLNIDHIPDSFINFKKQKLQMKYAAEGLIDKPVVNLNKGV